MKYFLSIFISLFLFLGVGDLKAQKCIEEMTYVDDLTIISKCEEVKNASSSEITEIRQSFYHVPFLFWLIFMIITLPIMFKILKEMIIILRK